MKKRKSYIFTNKKNSLRAIMSVILGVLSLASLWLMVFLSYLRGGETEVKYGFVGLLATLFSMAGLILAAVTARDRNYYRLFPVLGIVFNLAALGSVSLILYAGARL